MTAFDEARAREEFEAYVASRGWPAQSVPLSAQDCYLAAARHYSAEVERLRAERDEWKHRYVMAADFHRTNQAPPAPSPLERARASVVEKLTALGIAATEKATGAYDYQETVMLYGADGLHDRLRSLLRECDKLRALSQPAETDAVQTAHSLIVDAMMRLDMLGGLNVNIPSIADTLAKACESLDSALAAKEPPK